MPTEEQRACLRNLPQVEELLHHPALEAVQSLFPRPLVTDLCRASIDEARTNILSGQSGPTSPDDIAAAVLKRLLKLERPSLRRVINASGVIVHTNLGRSALAPSAVAAVSEVARGYSTLEYDTATMRRGSRHDHCEHLICTLTGAKAAIAVNNNAAAVMMVLHEFASGSDAIVSRGELVEIGGSFRVPDIMALSGARMVEVGTTNKTHLFDYERALTDEVALLLKVHPSNYRMTGFTESVPVEDLRELADHENARREASGARRRVCVYEDLGSGALVDIGEGPWREKTVREALAAGADLVSFSCDKLLGGPQGGIIVGNAQAVARLKKSPYARVLRLDKMTLAALEATLRLYLDEDEARREIPTLAMLSADESAVKQRAEGLVRAIEQAVPAGCATISLVNEVSRAGGGALPMCDIPTWAASVTFLRGTAQDCEHYFVSERACPVVARIKNECVLCDARTLLDDGEIDEIAIAFSEYFAQLP